MVRIKARSVLVTQIEHGLSYGIRRFFKHRDQPATEEELLHSHEELAERVMDAIDEVFDFSDSEELLGKTNIDIWSYCI